MTKLHRFINKVTIIGLGLIGSSIARALKEKELANRVVGCSASEATVNKALESGCIDVGIMNPVDAVKRSDVVILCSPPGSYGEIMEAIAPALKRDAIITDVGSVKHPVIEAIMPHLPTGLPFVPAHPIAGSEKSGVDAGKADLFVGKDVIITPLPSRRKGVEKITKLWEKIGANVSQMKPEKHDQVYASVSHLLHAYAFIGMNTVEEYGKEELPELSKEEKDIFALWCRLAGSDLRMWEDILLANRAAIETSHQRFTHFFRNLIDLLEEERYDALSATLKQMSSARLKAHRDDSPPVIKRSYSDRSYCYALTVLFPRLVACAHMQLSQNYLEQAGSGFWGVTAPLLDISAISEERLRRHRARILDVVRHFYDHITQEMSHTTSEDIRAFLEKGKGQYKTYCVTP